MPAGRWRSPHFPAFSGFLQFHMGPSPIGIRLDCDKNLHIAAWKSAMMQQFTVNDRKKIDRQPLPQA
jgi:hypothetical protein